MWPNRRACGQRRAEARTCHVDPHFLEDLRWWVDTDRRVALRVLALMKAVLRTPFEGLGKPEPLKQLAPNTWSRRLTQEHRVVYVVLDDRIVFVQARYHY